MLDHHRKCAYLGQSLADAGVDLVQPDDWDFDVLMVDTDHPGGAPAPHKHRFVLEAIRRGVQVGLYPHGGLPVLDYDGMRKPVPIAFEFVHGSGHKACYDAIGLKRRVEVVGWSYCDIRSPSPEGKGAGINHLVFAPIHPWADGQTILPVHRAANQAAYRVFLDHPAEKKTVRMFGHDEPNGVDERVETVEYTQSDLGLGIELIDSADAVISYGTFACTALARGKPTAMILPYPPYLSDDGLAQATRFAEYAEETRYPASIPDGPLDELFQTDTSEWEKKFIGGPLDVTHALEVLGQYKRNRKQRRSKVR